MSFIERTTTIPLPLPSIDLTVVFKRCSIMIPTFLDIVSGLESTHLINSFLPLFSGSSTSSPLPLNLNHLFTGVKDFNTSKVNPSPMDCFIVYV